MRTRLISNKYLFIIAKLSIRIPEWSSLTKFRAYLRFPSIIFAVTSGTSPQDSQALKQSLSSKWIIRSWKRQERKDGFSTLVLHMQNVIPLCLSCYFYFWGQLWISSLGIPFAASIYTVLSLLFQALLRRLKKSLFGASYSAIHHSHDQPLELKKKFEECSDSPLF